MEPVQHWKWHVILTALKCTTPNLFDQTTIYLDAFKWAFVLWGKLWFVIIKLTFPPKSPNLFFLLKPSNLTSGGVYIYLSTVLNVSICFRCLHFTWVLTFYLVLHYISEGNINIIHYNIILLHYIYFTALHTTCIVHWDFVVRMSSNYNSKVLLKW